MKVEVSQVKQIMKINGKTLNECKKNFLFQCFTRYNFINLFVKNKMILAGGSIVRMLFNESPSDLDMYFKDESYVEMFLNDIADYNEKNNIYNFSLICKTSNSYTYNFHGMKFQFIILPTMIHKNTLDLLNSFDFSVCSVGFDFEFDDFIYTEQFMKDINLKNITFNVNSLSPICSLMRLEKYQGRGFKIDNFELLKLSLSIQKLKFDTYKDVAVAFTGVSTGYYKDFVVLLTSEEYKDMPYDLNEMLELLNQFLVSKEVMKKLCSNTVQTNDETHYRRIF